MVKLRRSWLSLGLFALIGLTAQPAAADIAIVANDNHTVNNNGSSGAAKNAPPDTVAIIDLGQAPKLIASVEVPTSVVGAPTSV